MNPWWLGLAPAQATVTCGGAEHRLRWEAGELTALDHEDPEAERALAALGAERCTCVDVLDAWAGHRDDARVLVLASRGQIDPLAPPGDEVAQFGIAQPAIVGGFTVRGRGAGRVQRPRRRPATVRRAGASVSYAAGRGGGFFGPGAGPTGSMARKAEAEDELIALLGLGGGLPEVHLTMIGDGGEPSLATEDRAVRARLPFGWLVDVWAKGLATIWGRCCLAANTDDGQAWELVTVGPDFGRPTPIRVELSDRPADRG